MLLKNGSASASIELRAGGTLEPPIVRTACEMTVLQDISRCLARMDTFVPHDEQRHRLSLEAREDAVSVIRWKDENTERDCGD